MKRIFLLLMLSVISLSIFPQVPQAIKYQAITRVANGNILANQPIQVQVSLMTDSAAGPVVYSETHSTTTNQYGLVNLEIGNGIVVSGNFASIDWADGPFFVAISIDGNEMGISQLLSVPYALYAEKAGNGGCLWTKLGNNIAFPNGSVGINTTWLDATLKVEEYDTSVNSNTIFGIARGGSGVYGLAFAKNNESWMNVGVHGGAEIPAGYGGRGVYGHAWGEGCGYGVNGESYTSGWNYGVSGIALSKTGNTSTQYGGSFEARGDWNSANGVGTGTHFGVAAHAYGGGSKSAGIWARAQGRSNVSWNYGGDFYGFSDVQTTGRNYGVSAEADSSLWFNYGVVGRTHSRMGQYNYGVVGTADGVGNPDLSFIRNCGVYGAASNNRLVNYGVLGFANGGINPQAYCEAVYGEVRGATVVSVGVDGTNMCKGKWNAGVGGYAYGTVSQDSINIGVYGYAGQADTNYAMFGAAENNGMVNYGIYAIASNGSVANHAGFFEGNVTVTGDLNVIGNVSKGGGTFKIDHPLDPENKYLVHSFVESPDMLNIYSGNIQTDANGIAIVSLPDYFEAANKDFRYQLTCIGTFAQAIIKDKISGNRFTIQTSIPHVEVSWQVTAVRNDPYANTHRVEPVQLKTGVERGKYLHPEAYQKNNTQRTIPFRKGFEPTNLKKSSINNDHGASMD
ncbi:MAG: hypothetical protein NTU44_19535 [Bacteroidetes bacterium]|nr:hypothetical protein [Bacteroidota bacterium]